MVAFWEPSKFETFQQSSIQKRGSDESGMKRKQADR